MNIFVSGLSFNIMDEDLKELFAPYGTVSSAKVIMDKFTNRSKGFGFVEMSDTSEGERAIKELDGCRVDGRSVKVNVARPREERSGSGSYSGGKRSYSSSNRW
ncbi:MAG TPA: hypothetical protein VG847_01075 [Chitinophagaceae bacterium]|nr:hypothetical protein [Chitinophagaceae bacterium]